MAGDGIGFAEALLGLDGVTAVEANVAYAVVRMERDGACRWLRGERMKGGLCYKALTERQRDVVREALYRRGTKKARRCAGRPGSRSRAGARRRGRRRRRRRRGPGSDR